MLGPLVVHVGEAEVPLNQRKVAALLAFLAHKDTPVSRDALAGLLWGDSAEAQARASLRQALSALKKAIGDHLQAEASTISLVATQADTVNFAAFARTAEEARLAEAAEAYRGDLLEGLPAVTPEFDRWLETERAALRAEHMNVLLKLADAAEARNATEEVIALGTRLLALDPLQEHVHRRLIAAYARQGRHDAALKQFDRLSQILEDELGVRPEALTATLVAEVRKARSGRVEQTKPGRAAPSQSVPKKPSIAVLPFRSASNDEEAQFFAEGVAEDVIVELSREPDLMVIARASSFRFAPDVAPRDVADALGVRFLLTGSVRRVGSRVRVTAGLIRAESGEELWGDRFDRDLVDIFDIQTEIARTVTATAIGRISEVERQSSAGRSTERLESNQLVLHGLKFMHSVNQENMLSAIDHFRRATDADPGYARGWGLLALATLYERWYFQVRSDFREAVRYAKTAHALDPDEAKAHCAIGIDHLVQRRFEAARFHHESALKRYPNDDNLAIEFGRFLMYDDKPEEGLMRIREAMRLNPYHPNWYWNIAGRCLHTLQRYDEALECFEKVIDPPFYVYGYRAACLHRLGEAERSAAARRQFLGAKPDFELEPFLAIMPYRNPEARNALAKDFVDAGLAP